MINLIFNRKRWRDTRRLTAGKVDKEKRDTHFSQTSQKNEPQLDATAAGCYSGVSLSDYFANYTYRWMASTIFLCTS